MEEQEIVNLIKEELENNLVLECTAESKYYFEITLKYRGEYISWVSIDKN